MVRDSVTLTNIGIGSKRAEWKGPQVWSGRGMHSTSKWPPRRIRPLKGYSFKGPATSKAVRPGLAKNMQLFGIIIMSGTIRTGGKIIGLMIQRPHPARSLRLIQKLQSVPSRLLAPSQRLVPGLLPVPLLLRPPRPLLLPRLLPTLPLFWSPVAGITETVVTGTQRGVTIQITAIIPMTAQSIVAFGRRIRRLLTFRPD